jgi:hypothetical protein
MRSRRWWPEASAGVSLRCSHTTQHGKEQSPERLRTSSSSLGVSALTPRSPSKGVVPALRQGHQAESKLKDEMTAAASDASSKGKLGFLWVDPATAPQVYPRAPAPDRAHRSACLPCAVAWRWSGLSSAGGPWYRIQNEGRWTLGRVGTVRCRQRPRGCWERDAAASSRGPRRGVGARPRQRPA